MTLATVDLTSPSFRADPYSVYRDLSLSTDLPRTADGDWLLTRHADVVAVLRDHQSWSNDSRNATNQDQRIEGIVAAAMQQLMLFVDPPDHTRLRALVSRAFTPRAVEGMRPRVQAIVDELLGAAEAKGSIDVLTDFAFPLPVMVIASMLGVPDYSRPEFKQWSSDLARMIDPLVTEEQAGQAFVSGLQFIQYWSGLIEERRGQPRDDLLSALVVAEEEGDRLSTEELVANVVLLFIAGHETTMNLIGNGTWALLRNPDQLERWRSEPGLTKTAVEELLRFDGPVQLTARTALEDVDVGGQRIAKGQQVLTLLGAANRDPEVFEDPDRLDLARQPNPHVAFGQGIHFCLGAPLARLEAQVALPTLLGRFPDLRLAGDPPTYRDTTTLRGLTGLRVTWGDESR